MNKSTPFLILTVILLIYTGCESPEVRQARMVAYSESQRRAYEAQRKKDAAFQESLEEAIRTSHVVYSVNTNQNCLITYYGASGVQIKEYHGANKWFYYFNPTRGQKIQLSVSNGNTYTTLITTKVTAEIYVNGIKNQSEGTVSDTPYFHIVTGWYYWK